MTRDRDEREWWLGGEGERADVDGGDRPSPGKVSLTASLAPSAGAPLPAALRQRFGRSLGSDLGGVRVHTDAPAAAAASALHARAFCLGEDVYFGSGRYQPDTPSGQHLIAHEVVHTVQQRGAAPVAQTALEVSRPGDRLEREADALADRLVAGERAHASVGAAAGTYIAREGEDGEAPPPAASGPTGPAAALGDPAAPWTADRIRELARRPAQEVFERLANHDTRNGIALLHQTGQWERVVMSIPHGAACPQPLRRSLYTLVQQRAITIDEYRQLFHARFNLVLQRVFDAGEGAARPANEQQRRHDQQRERAFTSSPSWDTLDTLWNQLDHLPDRDVSENAALRIVRSSGTGTYSGAEGTYTPGTDRMIIDENGRDDTPGAPAAQEDVSATVRHEVGHAVHTEIGTAVDQWLQGMIRDRALDVATLRLVVRGFGGFPATYEHEGTQHPYDLPTQQRVLTAAIQWIGAGCPGFFPTLPPQDMQAWLAIPSSARTTMRGTTRVALLDHPQDGAGERHGYISARQQLTTLTREGHRTVRSTGRDKGAYAPAEFFAECYVEYYRNPQAARDPALRGGRLPPSVKRWLDGHIANRPPTGRRGGGGPAGGQARAQPAATESRSES